MARRVVGVFSGEREGHGIVEGIGEAALVGHDDHQVPALGPVTLVIVELSRDLETEVARVHLQRPEGVVGCVAHVLRNELGVGPAALQGAGHLDVGDIAILIDGADRVDELQVRDVSFGAPVLVDRVTPDPVNPVHPPPPELVLRTVVVPGVVPGFFAQAVGPESCRVDGRRLQPGRVSDAEQRDVGEQPLVPSDEAPDRNRCLPVGADGCGVPVSECPVGELDADGGIHVLV